jgi:uncharacterized protein involved in exopolysaccharide biosynthesis
VLALLSTLVIPAVYRSSASFVANSSGSSKVQAASASSPISGLLSQFGGSLGGDPSESPNFYIDLLYSRELLTRLLESKFPDPRTDNPGDSARLVDILRLRSHDPARRLELGVKELTKNVKAGMDPKTNLVWFTTDAEYPQLSSQMANRMIDLVSSFNRETRVSRSKSKRIFLERRLDSANAELRTAEENLRLFYEENRGTIIAPGLKFEEARLKRDEDIRSSLFLNLQAQLEAARIEEINDAALITVIDTAVVPRKAEWPRYGVASITGFALGIFIGILVAGSAAVLEDWRLRNREEWEELMESVDGDPRLKFLRRFRGRKPRLQPPADKSGSILPAKPAA